MCKVNCARTRSEYNRFFGFSLACGYSEAEAGYLKKYASPALNPIRTNERAYLYMVEGNKVTGRLLTWKDRPRDAATGQNRGYFALCDTLSGTGHVLLEEMERLQRGWGSEELIGPVAPDGSGFFNGMAIHDAVSVLNSHYMSVNLPEETGFTRFSSDYSFMLKVPETRRYMETADRARSRFGLKLRKLERTLFSDELQHCAAEFAPACGATLAARQAERIAAFTDRSLSFETQTEDGKRTGFILTLKGPVPRITTLFTGGGTFKAATACILIDAVHGALLKQGIDMVEAGVVNSLNAPSLVLTRGCGCKAYNEYRIYSKQLTKQ